MAQNSSPFEMKDRTAEVDPQDAQQNKVMGILAYLSWLVLIPIFAAKDSKFARFHANQGLLLAIGEVACCLPLALLSWIPFIGILFAILEYAIGVGFTVLSVFGIVNAAQGKCKEMPLIGGIRILK